MLADARASAEGGGESLGYLSGGGKRVRVVSRLCIGSVAMSLLLRPERDGLPGHGEVDKEESNVLYAELDVRTSLGRLWFETY